MITKLEDPSMYGYIKDTGHALRNAVAERALFCDPFVKLMTERDFKRVYFVGSGTSYNASIYISTLMQRYAKVEATAGFPTRFDEKDIATSGAYTPDQVLVVGVSQSGTSVSTIDVMRRDGQRRLRHPPAHRQGGGPRRDARLPGHPHGGLPACG